ncbi:hypothetical protein K435DRAFT_808129 [Dendrothele bispora CBS 962.96]|uniref:Uncharacterized protein n=1 Tax=Dendrothele bispora (strain CBS 962.96) TaxID=1314807 RepID=A0A4S8L2V9_DENBC|nr:hypothetical protein K435DRAFT_808129 [Dendrothele bispora CBS 962.96]
MTNVNATCSSAWTSVNQCVTSNGMIYIGIELRVMHSYSKEEECTEEAPQLSLKLVGCGRHFSCTDFFETFDEDLKLKAHNLARLTSGSVPERVPTFLSLRQLEESEDIGHGFNRGWVADPFGQDGGRKAPICQMPRTLELWKSGTHSGALEVLALGLKCKPTCQSRTSSYGLDGTVLS